jgi:hypothetical protein
MDGKTRIPGKLSARVSLKLTEEELAELEKVARRKVRSVNWVVRQLIRKGLRKR